MQLFSGNKGFRDEPLIRICDESQIVCVATQTLLAIELSPMWFRSMKGWTSCPPFFSHQIGL